VTLRVLQLRGADLAAGAIVTAEAGRLRGAPFDRRVKQEAYSPCRKHRQGLREVGCGAGAW
jgi:hypothetical protein